MGLTLKTSERGSYVIIHVSGRVDSDSAPQLGNLLNQYIGKGRYHLLLDFSGVEFISSAGIGVCVKALNDVLKKKGVLAIVGAKEEVKKVFDLLGFGAAFKFYPDINSAIS